MRDYYVYIMTNNSGTLYTGVTNDLERRTAEHKEHLLRGFTDRYKINRLLYYEVFQDVSAAIARAKQIKALAKKQEARLSRLDESEVDRSSSGMGVRNIAWARIRFLASLGMTNRHA